MRVEAVLFDFDGTLTRPDSLDFLSFRKSIGCPADQFILEFIQETLPEPEKRRALDRLDQFEFEAASRSEPNQGAEDLILYLRAQNIPLGIISRNSRRSIQRALQNFKQIEESHFEVSISRDDEVELKPSPEGVLLAAKKMDVRVDQMLLVGDFILDIAAGKRAGSPTVLLTNGGSEAATHNSSPDYVIEQLSELKDMVRYLRPLPAGKLPNDFLDRFLQEHSLDDPTLLVAPGMGEDTAAVMPPPNEDVIVLKSDPITFAEDRLGYYTLAVNANDIATSGATPRWLLTTLLFPVGSTAAQIHALIRELQQASREFGITLCGGHTEITEAVSKPIAVGQMVGTVEKARLIEKRRMAKGDQIILTKGVAVEGTSILARECPQELRALGMIQSEIRRCQEFLFDPGISILAEARIAAPSASAMHDVTEGGLATALQELSAAGGNRLRVDVGQIPVFKETQRICRLLGIHSFGLIGSGSLLLTCSAGSSEPLLESMREAGISAVAIGEVMEEGAGVEAVDGSGGLVEWPDFEADELGRAFERIRVLSAGL